MSREQKIGAFFLVGLVLLFAAIELTLGTGVLRRRFTVYATFRDVQGLDRGADVRLAGLRAGRVADMKIEGGRVVVEMTVDEGVPVRTDSLARLDFRALSGERFVSLSLGTPTAPLAAPGSVLEGETPAGFAEVVDQLADVAASVTALSDGLRQDAGRLLTGLGDLVEQNRLALGEVAQNFASISGKLDRGTGSLGLLLNDPALYQRATAALADVQRSVQDIGQVAESLAGGEGTLGKLITADDGLYAQVRETMDSLGETARNAEEITASLRAGQGTLGKALTDDGLYAEAQDTLRTVNRATQSLEDQSAISLLGVIATSLF